MFHDFFIEKPPSCHTQKSLKQQFCSFHRKNDLGETTKRLLTKTVIDSKKKFS